MYLFKTKLHEEALEKAEWSIFFFFFFNLYLNNYQKTDTALINNSLRP